MLPGSSILLSSVQSTKAFIPVLVTPSEITTLLIFPRYLPHVFAECTCHSYTSSISPLPDTTSFPSVSNVHVRLSPQVPEAIASGSSDSVISVSDAYTSILPIAADDHANRSINSHIFHFLFPILFPSPFLANCLCHTPHKLLIYYIPFHNYVQLFCQKINLYPKI